MLSNRQERCSYIGSSCTETECRSTLYRTNSCQTSERSCRCFGSTVQCVSGWHPEYISWFTCIERWWIVEDIRWTDASQVENASLGGQKTTTPVFWCRYYHVLTWVLLTDSDPKALKGNTRILCCVIPNRTTCWQTIHLLDTGHLCLSFSFGGASLSYWKAPW